MRSARIVGLLLGGMALAATGALAPASAAANPRDLIVPTAAYPTIQSAVDAAGPGDDITVRPGTYREQVTIRKDLTVTGAGAGKTTILAPEQLVTGTDGLNSIVSLDNEASVRISRLTVSGPGSGTCDAGALGAGIRVLGGAHLDLSHAAVSHIKDTPMAPCFRSANSVLIGDFPVGTGSATIRDSKITDYQGSGIVVLNAGSQATLLRNVVTGQKSISTDGIEFVEATGRAEQNTVSDNACREPDPGCGPDFYTELQHAGILANTGVVVTKNRLVGNQLGIYAFGTMDTSHNTLIDNEYFGLALQDGTFTAVKDTVRGGVGGVAVIASAVDTTARLDHVKITKTSGDPIRKFECCGFTATVTTTP
ncbi:right-handed parallel beta-helix repeat-containing protein [Streptomyces sp. NBC_00335]|uniref:right-handed parallel beta-helix repeat-containing protein n=1 Tax=unclassified Streptomyces TaxID=2593676 RepID=UPI002259A43A|nr:MULTISPECIES: right-handed parallel beta-helix repeat-containing protein [unclassified Streptomyces]MCX5403979.1 right-handed parallel beta-helix repeat-containing protein [Streptomyces sp. NBC_00086]